MPKIAIVKSIHPSAIKFLKNTPNFEFEIIEDFSKENLIKKLPNFDAITIKTAKLDAEVINNCKKLKIISRHGVGLDNVDTNSIKIFFDIGPCRGDPGTPHRIDNVLLFVARQVNRCHRNSFAHDPSPFSITSPQTPHPAMSLHRAKL